MEKSIEDRLTEKLWRYRKLEGKERIKRERAEYQLLLVVLASWIIPTLVDTYIADHGWSYVINYILYFAAFCTIAILVKTMRDAAKSEGECHQGVSGVMYEASQVGVDLFDLQDDPRYETYDWTIPRKEPDG
jgi:hypothetical protein